MMWRRGILSALLVLCMNIVYHVISDYPLGIYIALGGRIAGGRMCGLYYTDDLKEEQVIGGSLGSPTLSRLSSNYRKI